ncbi:hypothetical protein [Streptomyces tricolor]|uniref:hypothetical protein n=1 Tax=Streptomyces tricolor TaxID=68277 RepID=UPI0036ED20FA
MLRVCGRCLSRLCSASYQRSAALLALIANMVVIPLTGWGLGALLGLPSAAFIALILVASSPGGPFGAKLAMVQKGDVIAGAAMQVLLATAAASPSDRLPMPSSQPLTSARASPSTSGHSS